MAPYEIQSIKSEYAAILSEFIAAANIKTGDLVVLGCSTSEIAGKRIGKSSVPAIGRVIVGETLRQLSAAGALLAVQCCEHLNRALVVEYETSLRLGLETVFAVPKPEAGGSAAAAAYELFSNPVTVEYIKADAGIDIGLTIIGMHLKHVAVPMRLSARTLGNAQLNFAVTRPKYIGGPRTKYE